MFFKGISMSIHERARGVIDSAALVLVEAAVCERLRRKPEITLHPSLFNTPLIYDNPGRTAMQEIYSQYRDIALKAGVPILLSAPTWRVDRQRIAQAKVPQTINRDAVAFMLELRDQWDRSRAPVLVAGLMGPKNDCYQPSQGLSEKEALAFHEWQVLELAGAGVDLLLAQTMPALPEALGLARVMAGTGLPYIISFVINRKGEVFDGTPLSVAVADMDAQLKDTPPFGYMVNCAYPTFICADRQPASLFTRLLGIQANSSSRDQCDLDGSSTTQRDSLEDWVQQMLTLHRHGMKLLGGCCGTDDRYLSGIVEKYNKDGSPAGKRRLGRRRDAENSFTF
jgi:S-methylmethionine-dependent homocysteine/selenocysteine methylase